MFFATVEGKQHPLGISDPDDLAGAEDALRRLLLQLSQATSNKPQKPVRTVRDAVAEFLNRRGPRVSPGALRQYRFALETHLAATFGDRPVTSLTSDELAEWADRPAWGDSTRANYLGAVCTFLKWAGHPLSVHKPAKESRGSETVLTDQQFAEVLAAYQPRYGGGDFRGLLRLLRETGARPQEVANLTVEAVDWASRCAKLKEHKTKRHGAVRVLYFSTVAMTCLEEQRKRYGTGFLFRTRQGNAYRQKMIVQQMQRLSKRTGFRAIAYGLGRHSFATKALVAGVPDTVVAALLGQKSTRMIHAHYSHVAEQSRVLKDAVEKVSGNKAG